MTALRHDVAHLGHAELLTPEPERSLDFFVDILGLTETGRDGDSVYLRTWDDYEQFSLKLTAHDTSGLGVTALRASSQEALERTVKSLARVRAGHRLDRRRARDRPDLRVPRPGRPRDAAVLGERVVPGPARAGPGAEEPGPGLPGPRDRRPAAGPRQLPGRGRHRDHRLHHRASSAPGPPSRSCWTPGWCRPAGCTSPASPTTWSTPRTGPAAGDGCTTWPSPPTPARTSCARADICLDHGVFIETGPHKHAIQQTFFLYVYEPGGNRIELCNPVARLIFAPDWETDQLERGRAGQGPGLGPEDDQLVPYPRHPAGGPVT